MLMLYDALPQRVGSVARVPCDALAQVALLHCGILCNGVYDGSGGTPRHDGFDGIGEMVATMVLVAIVAMVAVSVLQNTFVSRCGHTISFYQRLPCDALSQVGDFDAVSKSAGARTSKPIRPGNEAG